MFIRHFVHSTSTQISCLIKAGRPEESRTRTEEPANKARSSKLTATGTSSSWEKVWVVLVYVWLFASDLQPHRNAIEHSVNHVSGTTSHMRARQLPKPSCERNWPTCLSLVEPALAYFFFFEIYKHSCPGSSANNETIAWIFLLSSSIQVRLTAAHEI